MFCAVLVVEPELIVRLLKLVTVFILWLTPVNTTELVADVKVVTPQFPPTLTVAAALAVRVAIVIFPPTLKLPVPIVAVPVPVKLQAAEVVSELAPKASAAVPLCVMDVILVLEIDTLRVIALVPEITLW